MFVDGSARLLVFRVGAERFGVPLAEVDEVIDAPAVQRLPDTAPVVLGIAPIRGDWMVVYDPRPLLHLPSLANAGGRNDGAALLFMRDNKRVALAVDDVFDALTVGEDEMRPAPKTGVSDGFVTGLIRRGPDLIAVLDCRALLDAATAANAEVGERKHS
ncbi:MAG: chemotaxis protein CheW [Gemmatimonadaceae bacterium]